MGTINHNALVVTVTMDRCIDKFDEWLEEQGITQFSRSPVVINGTVTFFFYPDGSKEGWSPSNDGDELREKIIGWMESQTNWYSDWVEIGYGEYGQKLLRGNNSNCFNDEQYAI